MITCCGYSLEVSHLGTSNEYPQHMLLWRNKKNMYLDIILSAVMVATRNFGANSSENL